MAAALFPLSALKTAKPDWLRDRVNLRSSGFQAGRASDFDLSTGSRPPMSRCWSTNRHGAGVRRPSGLPPDRATPLRRALMQR
jgi:hypothetical protein